MKKWLAVSALMGSLLSFNASSAIIFQDNFDSEAGAPGVSQLNYNGFANWTVSDGTVDVVSNGGWSISCYGGTGKCVDLDGSTGNAGILTSSLLTLTPGEYALSFAISGNQRGGAADNLTVTLGGFFNDVFNLAPSAPWSIITHHFIVNATTTNAIIFNHAGGDNMGIMLDNVQLAKRVSVPEPGTLALLGLGLVGLGLSRRKARAQ